MRAAMLKGFGSTDTPCLTTPTTCSPPILYYISPAIPQVSSYPIHPHPCITIMGAKGGATLPPQTAAAAAAAAPPAALSNVARSASPQDVVFVGLQACGLAKPLVSVPCNVHVCHAACTLSDVQFRSYFRHFASFRARARASAVDRWID